MKNKNNASSVVTSYHEDQLNKIDLHTEYAPTIQIKDSKGNKTNNMDINKESAQDLVVWLKNNFILNN